MAMLSGFGLNLLNFLRTSVDVRNVLLAPILHAVFSQCYCLLVREKNSLECSWNLLDAWKHRLTMS